MYSAQHVFIHHIAIHRIRTTEVIYYRIFWYIYETKTWRVVESWYKIKFNAPQHLPIYHKTTNTDPVTSNAIYQTQDRPRVNARYFSHICFLCTLHFRTKTVSPVRRFGACLIPYAEAKNDCTVEFLINNHKPSIPCFMYLITSDIYHMPLTYTEIS
jgi:hypothetical protein